ncbi:delta-60 repeat domain-containing protein [Pseudomonas corrugata]|uniref:Delta-60 repeat domain-containing protein n=2 Tax=Pseudomonas corrugata TaxID=47879 RepID=A0A8B6UPL2_9PSED|nr:delta-60 repeat domain-containing protein [Pseudomonas corrugata]MDU9023564.1 delta-60 repeat domain-containing protein [Pseudomonas corrugata]MDU9035463.1 delta-60 repeat domain-containing protein [Pseudomonas corrugata]MDU9041656.1 delta-60 repeat domain-containing protein [Pseudomonas corrugata]QTH13839.1 delta-60 repeat domain-containing protein [Pseudomonas corrugata]UZD94938.1 delta-60 repeat domain-containing protein [Pseudomonas corrugata]
MDTQPAGTPQPRQPGQLDPAFGTEGFIGVNAEGVASSLVCDSEGKLILALQLKGYFALTRYLPDGVKDTSFHDTTGWFEDGSKNSTPTRVLLQEDGKILLIGGSTKDSEWRPALMRFYATGSHDLVFGRKIITMSPEHARTTDSNYKSVDGCLQKDQKILVCAYYLTYENAQSGVEGRLFRLHTNGEPDTGFGAGRGFIDIRFHGHPSYACNVQTQSDGKIIVAGSWRYQGEQPRTRTVARYTIAGELDITFGNQGFVDIEMDEGSSDQSRAQINSPDIVSHIAIQEDDRILIAGQMTGLDNLRRGLLIRLEANGEIDGSFNNGEPLLIARPGYHVALNALTIQADGRIVTVGHAFVPGQPNKPIQAYERVSQSGVIEGFWQTDESGNLYDVQVQPNHRVVVSGGFFNAAISSFTPRIWGYQGA